ncbi:MAG TPA: glycosyltransferase family 2 protein [Chloroflexota bacterium]
MTIQTVIRPVLSRAWPRGMRTEDIDRRARPARDPRISVVIPALNEEENLPHVLPRIPEWIHEVILVPGNSTDGTVEVAQQLLPRIRIVEQNGHGKGAALRSGFRAATGDIIVMLDADGSTDPAEIPAFTGALLAGADYAKGTRFLQGGGTSDMPIHRQLGNWSFVTATKLLFGGKYSDLLYGYNAFWADVLPLLDVQTNGFEIETEMNVRALRRKLRVAEVPSFEAERLFGEAKLQAFPDGMRVLKTLFSEWRDHLSERLVRRQLGAGQSLAPVRQISSATRPSPLFDDAELEKVA